MLFQQSNFRPARVMPLPLIEHEGNGIAVARLLGPVLALVVMVCGVWCRPSLGAEVTIDGRLFRIPDGMELEVAAGAPLVERPITADFDERGFLYVTESSGSNDNVEKQLAERPHRVLRLEDVDGDGRYDRRTVFADKMMFPEGSLWHDGSLYVSAPPSIWKLTDTDDDGVADVREEWFDGRTLTGCANDLHGPYVGRDGWIYWCKGAFAEQTYETPGRGNWSTTAAHIFRRHPTELWVEPVMTGGMDNPVDVVFTPAGERIFTTTFLQFPAGGLRDGLIHAIYGGVYGKSHGVINGHVRTGDLMPVMTHLGAAAPAGLTLLESTGLGDDYRHNVLAALFNMHKVTRHILQPAGATFATTDSDLVATDDIDFHPTDLLEDADGSLIIVNTGGWYKLCCPTSQLWKPDVLGTIYRLRRTGAKIDDPRGLQLDWDNASSEQLIAHMIDPRVAVRQRAASYLAKQPGPAIGVLWSKLAKAELLDEPVDASNSPTARLAYIWLLARIGSRESLHLLSEHALGEPEPMVRQAALHAIALWRYKTAKIFVRTQLADADAHVRRAAAEAIGRVGDASDVPAIIDAARTSLDRVLFHSLAYALIEINQPGAVRPYMNDRDISARRIAITALDQIPSGGLEASDVLPLLSSEDADVRATAIWIIGRRSEWSGDIVEYLQSQTKEDWTTNKAVQHLLQAFAGTDQVRDWLGETLSSRAMAVDQQLTMLAAMAQSGLEALPTVWAGPLRSIFDDSSSAELVQAAAEVLRRVPVAEPDYKTWRRVLVRTAQRDTLPVATRLAVLGALPPDSDITDRLSALTLSNIASDMDVDVRTYASRALSRFRLTATQQRSAAARIGVVGPLEIEAYLAAFAQANDPEVAELLLRNLSESPALASLTEDVLNKHLASFGPEVQKQAVQLLTARIPERGAQRERIAKLVEQLGSGDVRRGQQVFHGKQAACFTCHAMGYLGGAIGPDLTHIGRTRTAHDLFEAVLYPSTSFVRSFEPWTVETKDGRIISGVIREQNDNQVVLVTTTREEVRVPRATIENMQPSQTSIMPTGLDQQLTEQSLVDLILFLLQSK